MSHMGMPVAAVRSTNMNGPTDPPVTAIVSGVQDQRKTAVPMAAVGFVLGLIELLWIPIRVCLGGCGRVGFPIFRGGLGVD